MFLNTVTRQCVKTCGSNYYRAFEIVNVSVFILTSARKDESAVYNRLICRPCPSLCCSCLTSESCLECVRGAVMLENGSCAPPPHRIKLKTTLFRLIDFSGSYLVVVAVFSLFLLSFTFIFLIYNRCKTSSNPAMSPYVTYKRLPSRKKRLSSSSDTDYH